jgi:plastocyanin
VASAIGPGFPSHNALKESAHGLCRVKAHSSGFAAQVNRSERNVGGTVRWANAQLRSHLVTMPFGRSRNNRAIWCCLSAYSEGS